MTLRISDLQSDSNLDSIRNSCDVSLVREENEKRNWAYLIYTTHAYGARMTGN